MADGKTPNRENLINAHVFVLDEMKRRGLSHKHEDGLDDATARLLGVQTLNFEETEPVDTERVMESLTNAKSFVLVPDFVSIVGSMARGAEKPRDVDVLVRMGVTNELFESLQTRLIREVGKDTAAGIHFVPSPSGPHGDHMPVYDLVLVKRKELKKTEVESRAKEGESD